MRPLFLTLLAVLSLVLAGCLQDPNLSEAEYESELCMEQCEEGSECVSCYPPEVLPDDPTGGGRGSLCENSCLYAGDGECDDGGPGSLYYACVYGTDCVDCAPPAVCFGLCTYDDDTECDDGGEGMVTDLCEYGSDCFDCGIR